MTEPDHTTESVPTTATTASTETTALPTRDRLVLAMSESLRTRGYGSTSMKDLLAGAGISSGSMYHSFPGGKEQLAAEAVRRVGFDGASRIRWVFDDAEDAATAVRRIFAALARDHEATDFRFGCPVGVPATEAVGESHEIRIASREVFDAWTDAYADGFVADGWERDAAERMALAVIVAYEGSVTIARATADSSAIHHAGEHLAAQVEAGAPRI